MISESTGFYEGCDECGTGYPVVEVVIDNVENAQCGKCITSSVKRLEAENARLRDLLRPLAERFAEGMKIEHPHGYNEHGHFIPRLFEHRDGDWRGVEVARAVTFAHMRQCCAALGIEVPE